MQAVEPSRLTDDLWLATHDSVTGRPQVSDRALGVGLATGLLAELVHGHFLELLRGELFRTGATLTDDLALRPVLARMEVEEAGWVRHSRHGHELTVWLSYLSYDRRAEQRVVERLSRAGLIQREERRRWWRAPEVTYRPCDSVTAANPANRISTALQKRLRLNRSQLCLAGLILATGLHHHAFATLRPGDRSYLGEALHHGLDEPTRELLRAADAAVGEAAMR